MPPIKRYMRLGGGKQQPLVTNLVQHAASFDKNMHFHSFILKSNDNAITLS